MQYIGYILYNNLLPGNKHYELSYETSFLILSIRYQYTSIYDDVYANVLISGYELYLFVSLTSYLENVLYTRYLNTS